jgi:hypothetical protein
MFLLVVQVVYMSFLIPDVFNILTETVNTRVSENFHLSVPLLSVSESADIIRLREHCIPTSSYTIMSFG